jgi:predicted amidohydrolase
MEDTPHTVEMNLERAIGYIREASESGAEIVCLPETVTTNGVPEYRQAIADSDSWLERFSEAAKQFEIAVLAPTYVMDAGVVYNQASVFDRAGRIVGSYRKVQPTGAEAAFTALGDSLPVIDLGFAKIGIMICMDIYFPEIPRIYAMKGIDLLFWPTVAHGPTQSGLEAQLRSRAIDNSLHVIESNLAGHPPYAPYEGRFYPGTGRIIDFNGDILAQTGRRAGLAIADIDLDEQRTTSHCVLIHEPDRTREDLESIARMDLYAKEYAEIARGQHRYYDSLNLPTS